MRNRERNFVDTVYQNELGLRSQCRHSLPHGFEGGPQNIEFIYIIVGHNPYPHGQDPMTNIRKGLFSGAGAHFFGIPDTCQVSSLGDNHCGRHNRAGQWASTGLIDPRNQIISGLLGQPFMEKWIACLRTEAFIREKREVFGWTHRFLRHLYYVY